jgi:hypothetical protein
MKKSIPKITLHRETVRTLVRTELARVIGGDNGCPQVSRLASSCGGAIHADSLIGNPIA